MSDDIEALVEAARRARARWLDADAAWRISWAEATAFEEAYREARGNLDMAIGRLCGEPTP